MFSAIPNIPVAAKSTAKNSAFKTLMFEMLKANGDFSKIN
jgi:hypothetical protein